MNTLESMQVEVVKAWRTACATEGVDPNSAFAVFSKGNISAKRYYTLLSNYNLSMYNYRKEHIYINPIIKAEGI